MSTKEFLKQAWYAAAWSDEVKHELLTRTIIKEPVLLYRREDGTPVAMGNVCPHRFAPLNRGKLLGDVVQCPYHGLRFNSIGQCVHIPHGDGTVSQKMAVPSYPVVERHKLIWVWMGNPADADPATIPDFSCHEDDELAFVGGMLEVDANYKLVVDNLMDLSHAATVHEGLLSMPGLYTSKLETIQRGTTVYANKWMPDGEIQPAHAMLWKDHVPGENCDQWAYMRWDAPAHLLLDVGVTKVGAPRAKGIFMYGTDVLTPKDEFTTYYFWGVTRNYDIDNEVANAQWREIIKMAFDGQDKPMIEAQQKVLGERDIEDMNPVMFSADTGSMRARRVLAGLIRDKGTPQPQIVPLRSHRHEVESSINPVLPAI
ncbi:aromatic ring-hydroxylating dioxygenase subunit alpha [Cupriavidus basilensis]|uniref:Phenylpropionate dioxygenase-related ring-hydroxylating dioxygenase, large terminal subunit n=1 Tax=Cupriavidus basilensis TaxID=68895 RepID=A0A0C4YK46_9BURK|nr:aromatic ring-hydroxylating dioxygenase subunit alpha [Cupriavidus basilensis]AJG22339.1 Phenylpropionate dioxygenase-related ring-hydroxylating dioxygenase, large terminal subunit [Cupriavidus basilensis]